MNLVLLLHLLVILLQECSLDPARLLFEVPRHVGLDLLHLRFEVLDQPLLSPLVLRLSRAPALLRQAHHEIAPEIASDPVNHLLARPPIVLVVPTQDHDVHALLAPLRDQPSNLAFVLGVLHIHAPLQLFHAHQGLVYRNNSILRGRATAARYRLDARERHVSLPNCKCPPSVQGVSIRRTRHRVKYMATHTEMYRNFITLRISLFQSKSVVIPKFNRAHSQHHPGAGAASQS